MLRIRLSASLLCLMLLLNLSPALAQGDTVNLLRLSGVSLSTNVPELGGHGVGYINDGAYEYTGAGFATHTNVLKTTPFPHYIDIDFGENVVSASTMSVYAFFASNMAVTNLDVAYWINGEWRRVREDIAFRWATLTGEKAEKQTAFINSRYTTSKIRLVIREANMGGGDYRIDEIEIFGQVVGKIERKVASAPKSFVRVKAGEKSPLPKSVEAAYTSGITGTEEVVWEDADFSVPGVKTITGTLVKHPEVQLKTHAVIWTPRTAYTDLGEALLQKSVDLLAGDGVFWESGPLFRPSDPLTRLELVQMLYAIKKASPVYEPFYADIGGEHFYYGVVGAMAKAGLGQVFRGKTFDADAPVTGVELASAFKDTAALEAQIAQKPSVTRGETAIALVRSLYGDISNQTLKVFKDNGKAVQNPDMGFMVYFYDNSTISYDSKLDSTDFLEDVPGTNTIYLRFPWCHVEPEEGVFNWSFIDTQLQRFSQAEKSVMLGITASETGVKYATPEWVKNAGAKGYFWEYGKGQNTTGAGYWMPDFGDPVFMEKLENMVARFAEKYDGNPNVSVVEIRSIGVWGEGHMADSGVSMSQAAVKAHIDLYPKYFKKTPLVIQDDTPGFNAWAGAYAASLGYGIRDDSLPGDNNNTMWWSPGDYAEAEPFWRNAPVILETFHMWEAYPRGEWITGETLLESMETWHASYVSIHHHARPFALAFPEFMERANRRVGYRLTPLEISWVEDTNVRSRVSVSFKWQNGGTAPFYRGGYPAITLRDKDGGIMGVFVDTAFNLKALEVGPPDDIPAAAHRFDIRLPDVLPGGEYDMYLSVGDIDGTPRVQMPIADEHPADRRYHIGRLNVRGDYDVKLISAGGAGDVVTSVLEITGHNAIPATNRPALEFFNANAPKFGDQESWLAGFDANAFESDWSQEKRAQLNETGKTTVVMKSRIGSHHYGKTYEMHFGMQGNDEDIIQGDHGRSTVVGLLRVSETGAVSLLE